MPRFTLEQLITRANSGNIGVKGLHRLQSAGLNPSELAASGVQSPLNVDPTADLSARRAALYSRAVTAAHDLQPGQQLSAGLQRRLALGAGGDHSATTFAPHNAQEVQTLAPQYNTLLDALKKRSQGIASTAGIYR